ILRVRDGVVVARLERDARAFLEAERARVVVLPLPAEVPVLDPDERHLLARGRRRLDLRLAPDEVHVRRGADDRDVAGQRDGRVARVTLLVRLDLDVVVPERDPLDALLDRLLREIDPDQAAIVLDLAARVVMHLDDDVVALVDLPAEAVGQEVRRRARSPAAEAPRREEVRPAERLVTVTARLLLEAPRDAVAIEINDAVVHDRRRARAEVGRDDE